VVFGITSERKPGEELRMYLAWRWFTGLCFDQEIPHHHPLSPRTAAAVLGCSRGVRLSLAAWA